MKACPRCGSSLSSYSLSDVEAYGCDSCGWVGVPVDHQSEPERLETWQDAIQRFQKKFAADGLEEHAERLERVEQARRDAVGTDDEGDAAAGDSDEVTDDDATAADASEGDVESGDDATAADETPEDADADGGATDEGGDTDDDPDATADDDEDLPSEDDDVEVAADGSGE